MENKKYYYLKLKENFYEDEKLIILQNMPDGYLYSDILMKLYLRSLKNNGKIMFNDLIPYTPSILAQVVRHQVGTVEKALNIFRKLGLVEILDNGAIYMLDIQNFIGKSSTEADRQREYYNKIHSEKDVCKISNKISTPEIDIDIELDNNNNNTNNYNYNNYNNNIYNNIIEEENKIKEEETLFDYIEQNFGRTLTPIEYEEISKWNNDELTKYAIREAILNGKHNIKYISTILNNYKMQNIKTVQEAQIKEEEYKNKKAKKVENSNKTASEKRQEMYKRLEGEYNDN